MNHDPVVLSAGHGAVAIGSHTLSDLTRLAPENLRSAASVVRAARDAGLGVYADVKEMAKAALPNVLELLVAEAMINRVILASATPRTVADFAAIAPGIPRAVLFRSVEQDPIELAAATGAHFLHPCWEDERRPDTLIAGSWLAAVRARELGVICWHEERPEVLAKLLVLGVDGICTDDPLALAELARR